ncbi:MAG: hypothetical protein ACTSYM_10390 [Candidatus Baldrarchaeia archaeon]
MVVWLKLKIRSKIKNNEVIVNGLVNSGYETESPEILFDSKIAKELGYYPNFLRRHQLKHILWLVVLKLNSFISKRCDCPSTD